MPKEETTYKVTRQRELRAIHIQQTITRSKNIRDFRSNLFQLFWSNNPSLISIVHSDEVLKRVF